MNNNINEQIQAIDLKIKSLEGQRDEYHSTALECLRTENSAYHVTFCLELCERLRTKIDQLYSERVKLFALTIAHE